MAVADTDFYTDSERVKPLPTQIFNQLLEQRAARQGQVRQSKLLNALTTVGIIAIYVVPAILAILYVTVLAHKARVGEWDSLETTLESMLIPITTYLAGLLSKNVLMRKNNSE